MSLDYYHIRSAPSGSYRITKLDQDYEVEGSYELLPTNHNHFSCSCPAGHKPSCRHREMLPNFIKANHIDDGWMLVWQTRKWAQPIGSTADKVADQLAELTPNSDQEAAPAAPPDGPEAVVTQQAFPSDALPAGEEGEGSSPLPPASGNPSLKTKDGLRRI